MTIEKIAVVGAGIVGVPMAAALARARIRMGTDRPARVVLIQRDSPTSGWKVAALNSGRSPLGGVEPGLADAVGEAVAEGRLSASHDYEEVGDADALIFCVQTDIRGLTPDYEPLLEATTAAARVLEKKPPGKRPLIILESTLAPTTMGTVFRPLFAAHGLADGRDILLGNSPNRVMPGFLLERIRTSDKIIGGLSPETAGAIGSLYIRIVTEGRLHLTNSRTAETVKTLENAYRDVRIAAAAELARYCDANDVDFHSLREAVNARLGWSDRASSDGRIVPTGGLLVPTIGVGGHCLPKDGVLLLWRQIESGRDVSSSLFLEARRINDESPGAAADRLEVLWGPLRGKTVALLGTAYRPNSEDARNSPALRLAAEIVGRGGSPRLHDPYVRSTDANLLRTGLDRIFTRDLDEALAGSDFAVVCAAHELYLREWERIAVPPGGKRPVFDGAHLLGRTAEPGLPGVGRGRQAPSPGLVDFAAEGFRAILKGLALEVESLIRFIDRMYPDPDDRLHFEEVRHLAETCLTGCRIEDPAFVDDVPVLRGFSLRLASKARDLSEAVRGGVR